MGAQKPRHRIEGLAEAVPKSVFPLDYGRQAVRLTGQGGAAMHLGQWRGEDILLLMKTLCPGNSSQRRLEGSFRQLEYVK